MSDDVTAEKNVGGVSPARKKISALILCGLAIVLIIEVRAGMGHMLSGKMLQEKSPDGVFQTLTLEELEPMLSLAPARTTIRETDEEIEYRYAWFSLLRPLFSRPEAAYYIVASKATPSQVRRYNSEAPTEEELAAAARAAEFSGETEMSPEAAAFTAIATGGGGGGGPGGGGPRGGGPPPQDPTVTMLDKDGDGELSEEELEGASAALLAADKNGDGTLTPDELRPAGGGGGGGRGERRRPPIDTSDEEEAAPSEEKPAEPTEAAAEPTEEKAADASDDAPEKTEEKPESEEAPASEKPASE